MKILHEPLRRHINLVVAAERIPHAAAAGD